jgi:hypothetical protein
MNNQDSLFSALRRQVRHEDRKLQARCEKLFLQWVSARNVEKLSPRTPAYISSLLDKRTLPRDLVDTDFEVHTDHSRIWDTLEGKIFISQPYKGRWDAEEETKLRAVCEEHGLSYSVSPPSKSWYYPGATFLVEVWRVL